MPSILQSPTVESPILDSLESDVFFHSKTSGHSLDHLNENSDSKNKPVKSVQDWYREDDEFGVPVFTKQRLIPEKRPLDQSSFLLHHPTLQRSVEIMVPPGHTVKSHDNPIYPMIPDGPIYIHHHSTLAKTPLQRALYQTHLNYCESEVRRKVQHSEPQALEYTFLQNQIGIIDRWLISMREKSIEARHRFDQC